MITHHRHAEVESGLVADRGAFSGGTSAPEYASMGCADFVTAIACHPRASASNRYTQHEPARGGLRWAVGHVTPDYTGAIPVSAVRKPRICR
jgi:hypothetical protein